MLCTASSTHYYYVNYYFHVLKRDLLSLNVDTASFQLLSSLPHAASSPSFCFPLLSSFLSLLSLFCFLPLPLSPCVQRGSGAGVGAGPSVERVRRMAQLAALRYEEERQKPRSVQRDAVMTYVKVPPTTIQFYCWFMSCSCISVSGGFSGGVGGMLLEFTLMLCMSAVALCLKMLK